MLRVYSIFSFFLQQFCKINETTHLNFYHHIIHNQLLAGFLNNNKNKSLHGPGNYFRFGGLGDILNKILSLQLATRTEALYTNQNC